MQIQLAISHSKPYYKGLGWLQIRKFILLYLRLGEDGGYKHYKNYYTENTLALNKYQHKEDKDRDRHVGHKFCVGGPVEFEWSGEQYGSRVREICFS